MSHHTKDKGDLGVVKVSADLAEKGYDVLFPVFTEHLPFDLVAYKDNTFYRIQAKYRSGESVEVPCGTSWADKNGSHKSKYNKNDFDYFGIYLPDLNQIIYPNISFMVKTIRTTLPTSFTSFYWYENFLEFTDDANKKKLIDFGITTTYKKTKANYSQPKYSQRKVTRPSKEELQKLLWEKPTIQLAKDFGVSDKAITKWAKSYNINKPPRGHWAKMKAKEAE
jgi:hypothetical protein